VTEPVGLRGAPDPSLVAGRISTMLLHLTRWLDGDLEWPRLRGRERQHPVGVRCGGRGGGRFWVMPLRLTAAADIW